MKHMGRGEGEGMRHQQGRCLSGWMLRCGEKLICVERYNYRNAVQALVRMSREEGVGRLYSGWVPNTGRVRLFSLAASFDVKADIQAEGGVGKVSAGCE